MFHNHENLQIVFYHTVAAEDTYDYWKRPNKLELSAKELKQVSKQNIIMFFKY